MIAERMEAAKTATLAAAKSAGAGNAWPAMNSDMVKPMPASAPARKLARQEYSSGLLAMPSPTASADAAIRPSGLPTASPSRIASSSGR